MYVIDFYFIIVLNPVFQFNSGSILFWQFQIKHTIEEKIKQRYITLNSHFVFVFVVVFFFFKLIFLVLFVCLFFLHTCHLKKIINQSTSNNIFEKIVTFYFFSGERFLSAGEKYLQTYINLSNLQMFFHTRTHLQLLCTQ